MSEYSISSVLSSTPARYFCLITFISGGFPCSLRRLLFSVCCFQAVSMLTFFSEPLASSLSWLHYFPRSSLSPSSSLKKLFLEAAIWILSPARQPFQCHWAHWRKLWSLRSLMFILLFYGVCLCVCVSVFQLATVVFGYLFWIWTSSPLATNTGGITIQSHSKGRQALGATSTQNS